MKTSQDRNWEAGTEGHLLGHPKEGAAYWDGAGPVTSLLSLQVPLLETEYPGKSFL